MEVRGKEEVASADDDDDDGLVSSFEKLHCVREKSEASDFSGTGVCSFSDAAEYSVFLIRR